jgi:hypothetical protein
MAPKLLRKKESANWGKADARLARDKPRVTIYLQKTIETFW